MFQNVEYDAAAAERLTSRWEWNERAANELPNRIILFYTVECIEKNALMWVLGIHLPCRRSQSTSFVAQNIAFIWFSFMTLTWRFFSLSFSLSRIFVGLSAEIDWVDFQLHEILFQLSIHLSKRIVITIIRNASSVENVRYIRSVIVSCHWLCPRWVKLIDAYNWQNRKSTSLRNWLFSFVQSHDHSPSNQCAVKIDEQKDESINSIRYEITLYAACIPQIEFSYIFIIALNIDSYILWLDFAQAFRYYTLTRLIRLYIRSTI